MTTSIAPNTRDPSTVAVIERLQAAGLELPAQLPRILWVPEGELDFTLGNEAIELAESAGLQFDDWQAFSLRLALVCRPDGRLVASDVGIDIARQNGKGAILEGRDLAGLFLLHEEVIHTAHQFKTALSALWRLRRLVEQTPRLHDQVRRNGYKLSHGEEGIYLQSGQQILFSTRTKGNARGLSAGCVILDEAMYLTDEEIAALMPTLSARSMQSSPQIWYTGSAVDQLTQPGTIFARIRNRGLAGGDPDLVYIEYSAEGTLEELADDPGRADDREAWQAANPGLDVRISPDWVAKERKSMDLRTFAVERLGVGDWPNVDEEDEFKITAQEWRALTDASEVPTPLHLAIDTRPDRAKTAIAAAGYGADDLPHVGVIEQRDGTGWVVDRVAELVEELDADGVAVDGKSPAASLIPQLENRGITVHTITTPEHAKACGLFFDLVKDGAMRHAGNPALTAAVNGSARRPLADEWAWSRKNSATDISPLVASTLALWGAVNAKDDAPMFAFG